ncbi:hypothetical protein V2S66_28920 [Streptomyces sp. V4-01]|uniref:Nickel transporter n=1 Tax=Actinacidiphila polyblastidii TaxID=3110430 RepID=A0ABU7PJH2_9ACTN|nr:hypothetical protein [Streptomyces sp. V4-01]
MIFFGHRPGARLLRRGAPVLIGVWAALVLAVPAASAHPLGNFTVNRYDGLTLYRDRVEDLVVVDTAEIPTLQAKPALDTDHDGELSPAETASYAKAACGALASRVTASATPGTSPTAAPSRLHLRAHSSAYRLVSGQAGLDTGRLECGLSAPADLGAHGTLHLTTGVDTSRIGWHEITARADGITIGTSDVPSASVSRELRAYPADLLADPLDARHTTVILGAGSGSAAVTAPGSNWPASWYAALDRHLGALTDHQRLTVPVGLLAIAMALVLGAGHAMLPGHGKTIMAAYLAGRRGRPRDAVTVAGTVTLTHTASVLMLGIALSVSSALVGEDVLTWLGTASGIMISAAGLWLLPAALRTVRAHPGTAPAHEHGHHDHSHGPVPRGHTHHGHGHDLGAGHPHDHEPSAAPAHPVGQAAVHHGAPSPHTSVGLVAGPVPADLLSAAGTVLAVPSRPALPHAGSAPDHHHDRPGHTHGLLGHHRHGPAKTPGRSGLIGIGIAGGLVPSPSALVVLLGSIALGRTGFGVMLVVCYGLGMAATLAAAGLLLLKLRNNLPSLKGTRAAALPAWGARITPLGTALLILSVGVGTVLRAMPL